MVKSAQISYDSFMASFGEYLRGLRKERGLSLRDLEEKVGISHNTLALYEREKATPSVVNGFAIAEYFGVPLEYFLKGKAVISAFRDADLRELFSEIDEMDDPERTIAKDFLQRLVRNRKERDELTREANAR